MSLIPSHLGSWQTLGRSALALPRLWTLPSISLCGRQASRLLHPCSSSARHPCCALLGERSQRAEGPVSDASSARGGPSERGAGAGEGGSGEHGTRTGAAGRPSWPRTPAPQSEHPLPTPTRGARLLPPSRLFQTLDGAWRRREGPSRNQLLPRACPLLYFQLSVTVLEDGA